jgi:hypothetical protein
MSVFLFIQGHTGGGQPHSGMVGENAPHIRKSKIILTAIYVSIRFFETMLRC